MKLFVNFYKCSSNEGTPNSWHVYSEAYETDGKARDIYEEAADHPWLKYIAVAVPVEFDIDESLRK